MPDRYGRRIVLARYHRLSFSLSHGAYLVVCPPTRSGRQILCAVQTAANVWIIPCTTGETRTSFDNDRTIVVRHKKKKNVFCLSGRNRLFQITAMAITVKKTYQCICILKIFFSTSNIFPWSICVFLMYLFLFCSNENIYNFVGKKYYLFWIYAYYIIPLFFGFSNYSDFSNNHYNDKISL